MLASERFGKALHSRDLGKYRVARRGTIVADPMLLWDGSIGRQEVVDAGLVSPDYRVYELADHVDSNFMRYVVRDPSMVRHYQGGARGTNVRRNRIARQDFLRIPFKLPPLPEQRKIAAILSAMGEVIKRTEAVIESLRTLKKAMMQELLTRGLAGRHARFKHTEIGEMPEEWQVNHLGDLTLESAFGPRFPATKYSNHGRYGTLRTTDISEDWEINYASIPRADLPPEAFESHCLRDGDVVVTRSGTCGVVCVFEKQAEPIIPGAFLIRFRLKSELQPAFLRLAMMSPSTSRRVQAMAAGGVQKNLSGTNLRALAVPVPKLDEQAEIVAALEAVQSRIRAERAYRDVSLTAKESLMSVLLTGELRVSPDEGAT
jgi:type I restriction enzyme S subunit